MHGNSSARAEKVNSDQFWVETKSGRSPLQTLGPDDGNDVECADGAEAIIGGEIADGGGRIVSLIAQAEEDIDARLEWTGYVGLRTEVGDGLAADGVLLIVKGDENLGGLTEMIDGSAPREEEVPDEEHEVHKGQELDRTAVVDALRVFTGPEAKVEANGDQVGNVVGSGIRGGSCLGNDG